MFSLDPRGGHNRYKFNKDFFKKWTPEMAYILGFMYADGNIVDSVVSRTQYVSFDSVDREIIEKIKVVLSSNHKIQIKPEKLVVYSNGTYKSREGFRLRIGSREMFADLLKLGLTPRKSLITEFPKDIPTDCLNNFTRGYFDGDGCVHIIRGRGKYGQELFKGLAVIFTSGSKVFLEGLRNKFEGMGFKKGKIYFGSRAYRLKYPTSESMQWFQIFYGNQLGNLFLKRKMDTFMTYFQKRTRKIDFDILATLKIYGPVLK